MTTDWTIGYVIGGVVLLAVVVLVTAILVLAKQIGDEAPKIDAALEGAVRNTAPLGEHRVHAGGHLRDQHGAGGVGLRRGERPADGVHPVVDPLDQVDEQAEQRRDSHHDDEADDDDGYPESVLGGVHR